MTTNPASTQGQTSPLHPVPISPFSHAPIPLTPLPLTSYTSTVDLVSLSAQQLLQVKKQLDDELEHLNNSFTQLRGAQLKFGECLKTIEVGVNGRNEGTQHTLHRQIPIHPPWPERRRVIVD